MRTILQAAADQREAIRAVTTGARMRAIAAGQSGGDPVVLDYELTNRGNEDVWMPDEDSETGYTLENVPVYLRWETTRTTPRPVGYLLPTSMASVVPLLLDHDLAVYRFLEPTTLQAEAYYATSVNEEQYFQGHYLKSVDVEKQSESVEVDQGWFWIPTAQSRAQLISYLMEPETDDNLITWGFTDHVLEVSAESVEALMEQFLGGQAMEDVPEEDMQRLRGFAERQMNERQRVPMLRVMTHQELPVIRVRSCNEYEKNRFYRPYR